MPKTLLLADDSVVIQKLVGLSFANEDIAIVATDNGDDAVARAREITPDVVLADVVMPGLSGYEVCEAIKRDPALAHVPVLLLTGTFEAFDESRATQAGADGHITKPFEAQALVQRVTAVIEAAAASAAAPASEPSRDRTDDFDFFDDDLTTVVSPPIARPDAPPSLDATPALDVTPTIGVAPDSDSDAEDEDANALSGSSLFGSPGEAEADPFETVGTMALGESLSEQADRGGPSGGPARRASPPPVPPTPTLPEPTPLSAEDFEREELDRDDFEVGAVALETDDDPLADLARDLEGVDPLGLDGPMDPADLDLDVRFGDEAHDPDATVFVGPPQPASPPSIPRAPDPVRQVVSSDQPIAPAAPPPVAAGPMASLETLRIHAPKMGIDSAAATARVPVEPSGRPEAQDTDFAFGSSASPVIADLDADLAQTGAPAGASTSPSPTPRPAPPASTTVGTPTADFELPARPEPFDLGPSNVTADELDFAFDVSEQLPVEEAEDPLGDSFASFADLVAPGAAGDPEPERRSDRWSAATVVEDYDVSASELLPPPIPTPARATPLPTVDFASGDPSAPAGSEARSTPAPEAVAAAEHPEPAWSEREASPWSEREDPAWSEREDPAWSESAEPAWSEGDELELDPDFEPASTALFGGPAIEQAHGARVPQPTEAIPLPEEPPGAGPDPVHAETEPVETGRRVSDLSPLMEQRIHETLEKIAWEAFSDLSETIVKQVLTRVEQIAWEVIPEMAESLVREEIRRMKGEDE